MSDAGGSARASALVGLCALVTLAGLAMLAAGAVMFTDLGRSPAGADAEGPALTEQARAIVETYAARRTAAQRQMAAAKGNYRALGDGASEEKRQQLRIAMTDATLEISQARQSAEADLKALRAGAGEPVQCIGLLAQRAGGKLALALRAGEFSAFGPLGSAPVKGTAVQRISAEGPDRGLVIFQARPSNPPPGSVWRVIVVYGGIRLMQPGWGPLQTAAQWNGAGLVVLLVGGFGLYFSIRRRRRALYETAAAPA